MQEREPLGRDLGAEEIDSGRIREACDEAEPDRIFGHAEDDRDGAGRGLGGNRAEGVARGRNHRGAPADQISGERLQAIRLAVQPVVFDRDILALHEASLGKAFAKCGAPLASRVRGAHVEESYERQRALLCPRRNRPCRRRAAEKGDEFAPSHGPCLTPRTAPYHIVEKSGVVHHTKMERPCRFRVMC